MNYKEAIEKIKSDDRYCKECIAFGACEGGCFNFTEYPRIDCAEVIAAWFLVNCKCYNTPDIQTSAPEVKP